MMVLVRLILLTKINMTTLSQLDRRWANKTIGNTVFKIGRWGCTITSLCMLLSYFHEKTVLTPDEASKKWLFTSNAEIYWSSNFEGMRFVYRYYQNNPSKISEYANDKDKGVILEVNNSHWVFVEKTIGHTMIIHDPIDGKKYQGLPRRYAVTGFALFEKEKLEYKVSDYAIPSVAKARKKKIATKWDNPQEVVANATVEHMLIKAGIFDRNIPQGHVTKEDMVVAFDRLGMLE